MSFSETFLLQFVSLTNKSKGAYKVGFCGVFHLCFIINLILLCSFATSTSYDLEL